jgi:3-deoxy-D-manno-octulosonate 8-phosphate phosphatase (KDO 8-P phosphatase)
MALTAPQSAVDRACKIKIVLFDVDGVLTDGTIWLVPTAGPAGGVLEQIRGNDSADTSLGVQSSTMVEVKGYSCHDGLGISLARMGGLKCGVITKRISETVATRARDLKLEFVYQGQAFKMEPVRRICAEAGVTVEEICYVGDDIVDLPVMREVGFAVATANARERVKAEAHYITPNPGGYGAGRDVIEFILEAQGKLEQCISSYVDKSTPIAASMDVGGSK